jgi:cellulose synthase/poly-beta-1,6-N-acetylglucosamine synthase-like glycosyltransferase
MNSLLKVFAAIIQILIGYNLVLPFIFLIIWFVNKKPYKKNLKASTESDFAIIVTVYQHVSMLNDVVDSILNLKYKNYQVYIVADNCEDAELTFLNENISVLKPTEILASNTKSHQFAVKHFIRKHEYITIIDSDNLVHEDFLTRLNESFKLGYTAVQGLRAAKNLNTNIACLDAARDLYYHLYDGKILFEIGSSATLSGSGMAFNSELYQRFLNDVKITGAGFDKVLQAWLLLNNHRIAFDIDAVVFDEKTSKAEQLVQQRSRWINSWFKYAMLGSSIFKTGLKRFDKNQMLFGIVLLRPPLFIFLALSMVFLILNLSLGNYESVYLWTVSFLLFVISFIVALKIGRADKRIIKSLFNIPTFVYYQFVSLLNAKRANKISVSTKH